MIAMMTEGFQKRGHIGQLHQNGPRKGNHSASTGQSMSRRGLQKGDEGLTKNKIEDEATTQGNLSAAYYLSTEKKTAKHAYSPNQAPDQDHGISDNGSDLNRNRESKIEGDQEP